MTVVDSADMLTDRARQALNRNDTEEAVRLLAQVAEQSTAALDGDSLHPTMAPVWMLYGRALLDNGRRQANIFGETILARQADKEALALELLTKATADSSESAATVEPAVQDVNAEDKASTEDNTAKTEPEVKAEADVDEEWEEDVEEEEEEEETGGEDFEAAWEVLETARLIYANLEPTPANRFCLADVHLLLAEVSQEGGRYAQAVEDVRKALEIKTDVLRQDANASDCAPCVLAEVHYRLSSALELEKSDLAEALKHAQTAHSFLSAYLRDVQAATLARSDSTHPLKPVVVVEAPKDKGKQPASAELAPLPTAANIAAMTKEELLAEADKMTSIVAELADKIQELGGGDAIAQVVETPVEAVAPAKQVDSAAPQALTINDLSSLVKKKKPRLC